MTLMKRMYHLLPNSISKPIIHILPRPVYNKLKQYALNSSSLSTDTISKDVHKAVSNSNIVATKTKRSNLVDQILLSMASELPDSNGCNYFDKIPLKLAIIGDLFMVNYYKDCFSSVRYVTPDNYQEVITDNFDVLIYTTCWQGVNNEEWRGVKFRDKPVRALDALINHCEKNKIPTVFQSIEDPSNYDYFLPIAKKFDHVFTSDADTIPQYKSDLGHHQVYYGEYGVNPQFNNPIGSRRHHLNAAFFAGSYPSRYTDRCQDMLDVFRSVLIAKQPLVIADRNYGSTDASVMFPEEFRDNIIDKIEHATLQKFHKIFRYNINFNSIKNSSTMCAMRIYELQAQGKGILSNYAKSVYNKFPAITIIPQHADLTPFFSRNDNFLELEYEEVTKNLRNVMSNKTSYDIIGAMLETIGVYKRPIQRKVLVVINEDDANGINLFNSQIYKNKEYILIKSNQTFNKEIINDLDFDYFTFFNPNHFYGDHYLEDMINAFKYTDSRYITKGSFNGNLNSQLEHEYTDFHAGICRTIFSSKYFEVEDVLNDNWEDKKEAVGGYSIDPFNYLPGNKINHAPSSRGGGTLTVIVPVYNNGDFLESKCIKSLRSNYCWSDIHVILIDDGSTDDETLKIVNSLVEKNTNITSYLFEKGGSGSASRARNKGLDLCETELVSFLDPDNEISPGAYDKFIEIYSKCKEDNKPVDYVSGYQLKVGSKVSVTGMHTKREIDVREMPGKGFFERGVFPVISTQAAVISSAFIERHQLRFVEGAAGQDTLFGWELLALSTRCAFTSSACLYYYYERQGSVTNTVDVNYFEKKLVLEIEQKTRLENHNIYKYYNKFHHDSFFENWYIPKYKLTSEIDRKKALDILNKIQLMHDRNPYNGDII